MKRSSKRASDPSRRGPRQPSRQRAADAAAGLEDGARDASRAGVSGSPSPDAPRSHRLVQRLPRRRFADEMPGPFAERGRVQKRRRGLAATLYRYIAIETVRVMALSMLAISLVGTVVLAFQLARSGIRLDFLWPVLLKSLAYPLFFSIPVSLLFGVTLGLGRLSGDLEINAMRANGLSHGQIALPVIVLSVLLTAAAFYLNGEVIPEIHYEKGNLRDAILGQLEDLGSGTNRSLLLPRGGRLFVESYHGTRLKGVHLEVNDSITQRLSRDLRRQIRNDSDDEQDGEGSRGARRARPESRGIQARPTLLARECDLEIAGKKSQIVLNLRGVKVHIPQEVADSRKRQDVFRQTVSIGNFQLALPFLPRGERVKDRSWRELWQQLVEYDASLASARTELGRLSALVPTEAVAKLREADASPRSKPHEPPDRELTAKVAELRALRQEIEYLEHRSQDAKTELHRRIAFSLATLSFALAGLPLVFLVGGRSRLVPFFLGNIVIVLPFFLLVMLGVKLGESGVPPLLTLGAPTAALLALAAFLWMRVLRK